MAYKGIRKIAHDWLLTGKPLDGATLADLAAKAQIDLTTDSVYKYAQPTYSGPNADAVRIGALCRMICRHVTTPGHDDRIAVAGLDYTPPAGGAHRDLGSWRASNIVAPRVTRGTAVGQGAAAGKVAVAHGAPVGVADRSAVYRDGAAVRVYDARDLPMGVVKRDTRTAAARAAQAAKSAAKVGNDK